MKLGQAQFLPGQMIKESGVYSVHHYAHRLPHNVYVRAGVVLPECNSCAHRVRFFALTLAVAELAGDPDLAEWTKAAGASESA